MRTTLTGGLFQGTPKLCWPFSMSSHSHPHPPRALMGNPRFSGPIVPSHEHAPCVRILNACLAFCPVEGHPPRCPPRLLSHSAFLGRARPDHIGPPAPQQSPTCLRTVTQISGGAPQLRLCPWMPSHSHQMGALASGAHGAALAGAPSYAMDLQQPKVEKGPVTKIRPFF